MNTSETAIAIARRTTRRSFVRKVTALGLGLVGVSIASTKLAPVARATHFCFPTRAELCNLCGNTCLDSACGAGGGIGSCPTGTTAGSQYWTGCCYMGGILGWSTFAYVDCCCAGCTACGHACTTGCDQPTWCPANMTYKCTKAVYLGGC